MRIFVLPAVAVLSTLLVLTGCAASAPIAPAEPSGAESSSPTPSAPRIQSLSEIAGTARTGTDVGIATYTATFDVETQVLSAESTTTGGSTGSVDLRRTSY